MIATRTSQIILIGTLLCTAPLLAQAPAVAPHPTFAGVWTPSDPARSDRYFDVGMTAIPGRGRLTIEQRDNRFTVTITMPDDRLDPILDINGRFYTTIVYRLSATEGRSGGAGAGGPRPPSGPTWFGDRLVVPNPRPTARPTTATYSLDGDRLKVETHATVDQDRASTITEWFTRVR